MQSTTSLKGKLIVMNFLEYAVWGAWLISLGVYLGTLDFTGGQIGAFFATMGIASIFMPTLMGIVADKWIPDERLTSICHLIAGGLMIAAAQVTDFTSLYTLILLSVCFYMPTLGLTNATAYSALNRAGLDTVKHFPPIRVFGTVGFICAMLVVDNLGFKTSATQLYISAGLSFALAAWMFVFPSSRIIRKPRTGDEGLLEKLGLEAFRLFKRHDMAIFFLFSVLLGICLQITNAFANVYITGFGEDPAYAGTFGVEHSGTLISLSQISEALCILMIPFFLKRFGIKAVMMISFMAWVLRFAFLGWGNPGDGVALLIFSMIIYGVAFDFFNISGSLYVDKQTSPELRSSAQGVFLMMTNGLGSTIGAYAAGFVVDRVGFPESWFIFAGYALVAGILFWLLFHDRSAVEASQA